MIVMMIMNIFFGDDQRNNEYLTMEKDTDSLARLTMSGSFGDRIFFWPSRRAEKKTNGYVELIKRQKVMLSWKFLT